MREKIFHSVVSTIAQIQSSSGYGGTINGSTRPLRDLQGFDSYSAVETIGTICAELGIEIKDDFKLFRTNETKEACTINEIVDSIFELVEVEQGRQHG